MKGSEPRPPSSAFPRLNAPLFFRARGLPFFHERPPRDVSLGGVRVYSDEPMRVGTQLDVELALPDGTLVSAGVEVAFVDTLEPGAPARYDVGLRFIELRHEDRPRLERVLG